MQTRLVVTTVIEDVAREQGVTLAALHDDLLLLDSGLDSLCVAIIVARLEDRLDVDPLGDDDDSDFPVTVGDFVALYERAVADLGT